METTNDLISGRSKLLEQAVPGLGVVIACALGFLVYLIWFGNGVPSLIDPIPFVFNTVQYILDNERFMVRAKKVLKYNRLAKFNLFTRSVFLIRGQQNVQKIFTSSHKLSTEKLFTTIFFPALYRMPQEDAQRFAEDNSGRSRVPVPGLEHLPSEERLWYGYERLFTEFLGRQGNHLRSIAIYFCKCYTRRVRENYAMNEWTTISITNFCRRLVTESYTEALFGPSVFELNPKLIDAFWDLDSQIFPLALGIPKWLYPRPHRKQEYFFSMIGKWIDDGWAKFDWNSPAADADWEPRFGARINREVLLWIKERGLSNQFSTGSLAMFVFGLNSNSIPTTMWVILEIVKDPGLLQLVREEVATTYVTDPETKSRTIDVDKLVKLPLLQSIFTEVLRLHMNFNLLRHVNEPVTMDGCKMNKGDLVSAPMVLAHYNEADWSRASHPASEFWAERHVKYTEEKHEDGNVTVKREFALAGRPSSYFPFGGGHHICPGRYIAKQQILAATALFVTSFEVESTWWTRLDGSPSDRPAQGDKYYSGTGGMPPDRDLKIRCKRIR
ncbi:putative cytochrome P450 [Hypoxylon sp. FL1857]|nr:putative cytochrome P450 [Hypoxylon sp. FL1857]